MNGSEAGDTDALNWDKPGILTILIQGGLFASNIVETANHCLHWRQLFPSAQIVLSISTSDIIVGTTSNGRLTEAQVTRPFAHNSAFLSALRAIERNCDTVAVNEDQALPLPPIKIDTASPNNVNLQISAARSGLTHATGEYVLRVRSDLIFQDRSFIDQFLEAKSYPRGYAARFEQRVLISPLYTLNPYTFERMPLHFSDWFHFGRNTDLVKIWSIPHMKFADSIYYSVVSHAAHSNFDERLLLTRLAVEQHIMINCFKDDFSDLIVEYHNDLTSTDLSVDILTDNFVICDLVKANCLFHKYASDFANPHKGSHCVLRDDWKLLASTQGAARKEVLSQKAAWVDRPQDAPFPKWFDARALNTHDGVKAGGKIVSRPYGRVVMFGPYTAVPAGGFLASVYTEEPGGKGIVELRVTADRGHHVLASRTIDLARWGDRPLEIPFDVDSDRGAFDVEVVCEVAGLRTLVITGLMIDKCDGAHPGEYYAAGASNMGTTVGRQSSDGIKTLGKGGLLLFGPWITLKPGSYRVTVVFADVNVCGTSRIEITSKASKRILAKRAITGSEVENGEMEILLSIKKTEESVEFRIHVDAASDFSVRGVAVDPLNVL